MTKNTKPVALTVDYQMTGVTPPIPRFLRSFLSYRAEQFAARGPRGWTSVTRTIKLWAIDGDGRLCFPTAMLSRVRIEMRRRGYEPVTVDTRTLSDRLTVIDEGVQDCGEKDGRYLDAIKRRPIGRIEVHDQEEMVEKIALIARLFPKARGVVASARRQDSWLLWQSLGAALQEKVGFANGRGETIQGRWLVGTYDSIPRDQSGKFEFLFVTAAVEGLSERALSLFVELAFPRVYAFAHPQERLDNVTAFRSEAILGPIIYSVRRPRNPVKAVFLPCDSAPNTSDSPLGWKRNSIWRNKTRNEFIAQVASAVQSSVPHTLRKVGVPDEDVRGMAAAHKICLIVDLPLHGRTLLRLLPGWHLVTLDGRQRGSTKGKLKFPLVVTSAFAATHQFAADVIICATGTAWAPTIKKFPPISKSAKPRPILVIDFADRFHARPCPNAAQRARDYRQRGISVSGAECKAP